MEFDLSERSERVLPAGGSLPNQSLKKGAVTLIHALLVIAAVLLVLWFLFHATGALVNLIWIAIVVLVVLWLIGMLRGRSAAP